MEKTTYLKTMAFVVMFLPYLPRFVGVVMNAFEVDLLGAFVESSGVAILAFFPSSTPCPWSFLSS